MRNLITVLALAIPLATAACGKDKGGGGGGGEKATVTLDKLDNLKIDVDKGTKPSMMGSSVMLMSMSESFTVDAATDSNAKTIDEAKKNATDLYTAKNIKEVKVDGGWGITFENKGSMGENFWLTMRRDIGGKSYVCSTSVGNKALRDGAVAACKTLRK